MTRVAASDPLLRLACALVLPRAVVAAAAGTRRPSMPSLFAPRPRVALSARALGNARRRFHRPRLGRDRERRSRVGVRNRLPRISLRLRRWWCCSTGSRAARASQYAQALMAARARRRLARRRGALPRLQRRAEPPAARLSLRRQRGDRLDAAAPARAKHRRLAVRRRRLARRQRAAQVARARAATLPRAVVAAGRGRVRARSI